jgi:TPR repeat protein
MFHVLSKFLENDPDATTIARGHMVRHADAEALNWLIQTAEQGDAKAQNNLGFMYDVGLGVRQDDAEARRWYSRAAAQGDAKALHNLGLMSNVGHDVPHDDATVPGWYWKAGSLPH